MVDVFVRDLGRGGEIVNGVNGMCMISGRRKIFGSAFGRRYILLWADQGVDEH